MRVGGEDGDGDGEAVAGREYGEIHSFSPASCSELSCKQTEKKDCFRTAMRTGLHLSFICFLVSAHKFDRGREERRNNLTSNYAR